MCIYIRYSMSIIEKAFHYEENEISVIKCRDEIWFRGKDIAKALGYEKTRNAILKHVNDDDKSILEDIRRGPDLGPPLRMSKGVQSLKMSLVFIVLSLALGWNQLGTSKGGYQGCITIHSKDR